MTAPVITWHGPDRARPGANAFKVIVRHGSRVAHHDRLSVEQYEALLAAPSLEKPGRTQEAPTVLVNRLYAGMGLPAPVRA
jgi:hypothetical protein